MRIDFLGLQAFLSIAERGSFQRAAALRRFGRSYQPGWIDVDCAFPRQEPEEGVTTDKHAELRSVRHNPSHRRLPSSGWSSDQKECSHPDYYRGPDNLCLRTGRLNRRGAACVVR